MLLVALDIGTKSLGWATWNKASDSMRFGVANLTAGLPKKQHTDYALLAKRFVDTHSFMTKASCVLIERQLSSRMKQVATAFRCFCWTANAMLISPITVKRYFNTSTGNYAANKNAAVVEVKKHLSVDNRVRMSLLKKKAQTDIADACLMVLYYAYKNKLKKRSPA
jgi:hypothetical protein